MSARIAFVTHSHYPQEPRARRMAEAVATAGHRVEMICLRPPGDLPEEEVNGVRIHRVPVSHAQGQGARGYVSEYARFFRAAASRLLQEHRREPFALVQVYNPPDILALATLPARLGGARVVLDVRDLAPELYQSRFGLGANHPLARALRAQERLACQYADAVTVCTEWQKRLQAARGIPISKLTVILNSPDEAIFARPLPPAAPAGTRIVYHGAVLKRYGVETLLRAAPAIARERPDLHLDIYGEGDYLPEARRLAGVLGVADRTTFHGYVPIVDLPAALNGATIGVAPVVRDVFTETILPTKILEYAFLGIPVVAAWTANIEENFPEGAVTFFESANPDDLAAKALVLCADREQARVQTAVARERVASYGWQRQKAAYLALIEGLLRRPSGKEADS
jgi:glycosyltransferase involved in cell wall biosynthesis